MPSSERWGLAAVLVILEVLQEVHPPSPGVRAAKWLHAKGGETQPVAWLKHDHVEEASFNLKVEISTINDNNAWFRTHSSLVGGALQGFENQALIPFFYHVPNLRVVVEVFFFYIKS